MKNKFGFDLPRLKIGATKSETKFPKEIPIGFDSPPPTPKSVRPPLSPRTDYELRTACALILQEYKPSDVVYEEQYGELSQDAQEDLEYEIVKSAVEREIESPTQPTFSSRKARQRTLSGELISERRARERRPAVERSPLSEEWTQSAGKRRSLLERAEELRSRLYLEEPTSPIDQVIYHRRSGSGPLLLAAERQSAVPTSDMMAAAEGLSPQTEDEEYPWTGSTAPTTAGFTPAQSSNRTSNLLQHRAANDSSAKFLASDTEWMRQELEKYKKAQEEGSTRPDLDEHAIAGATAEPGIDTKESSVTQVPPLPPIPAQNPMLYQRMDNRPSGELSRSGSRKRRSTPRSESRAEMDLLRPESRKTDDEPVFQTEAAQLANATANQSFHRKPLSGTAAPLPSHNVSAAVSRSRSFTRQIREYIRPSSRTQSRNASRPASRAKSVESLGSSAAPSEDSSSRWRRWKPFNRRRGSNESDELYRPDSKDSSRRTRGQETSSRNSKPPVNLNRELPPLPSLDQWKDEDYVPDSQWLIADGVTPVVQNNPSNTRQMVPPTTRSQKPSLDSTGSNHPRDSVLIDNTIRIHPKRLSSLGMPPDNSQHPTTDPDSVSLPQSPAISADQRQEMYHNRNMQAFEQPPMGTGTIDENPNRPAVPPKDRPLDYARAKPANSKAPGRSVSQRLPFATRRSGTSITELHSRTISDQLNFSRKLSSEDYSRVHDLRSKNPPESPQTTVSSPREAATSFLPEKEKKKRWWQPVSKLKKSHRQSWMALGGGNSNGL